MSALVRMHDLANAQSQFLIATHSPILMAYPDAYIYSFSSAGIQRVDYYDTEHYRVTHDFLVNPKRMLHMLLAPDDKPKAQAPKSPTPASKKPRKRDKGA